jgi:peptidoglycan-associated lipoprotein
MRKFVPLMLLLAVVMLASACGKEPPDAELAAAKAAVADAQASGAGVNCPDKMKAAEDMLAKAEAQYAAEEYEECKLTCAETIKLAEIAKACPPPVGPPPPPKPTVSKKPDTGTIFFDTDKYNIRTSEVGKAKAAADEIKAKWAGKSFVIEGHCDERGSDHYNQLLGDRRASSVKKYLTSMGVTAGDMITKSYGEAKPVDPGHNELSWAKNRRVAFIF